MEFWNNKENDSLNFKLNSEGIDINNIEPRLILTTKENKNYLFLGKVEKDICKFEIPKLESYEKGEEGKIKFEIVTEDLYFPVWEDKFEIKTKASIKIEEMIENIKKDEESKKFSVKAVLETNNVKEKKEEPSVIKEKKEDKKLQKNRILKDPPIKHFKDFI